tara:strand:+ start:750 stop:896 length:147 start_codon:yes stop_codon:yes gene_type:complete
MPVYLRLFYLRQLNEQHKKEREEMDKAKRGSKSRTIKRPTFSPKSPKR